MIKKLKVYGTLRKFLGQAEFEVDLNTPIEAISFLKCNFKGVEEHMAKQHYTIQCGSKIITEDLLNLSTQDDIKIIPLVHGNIFPAIFGAGLFFAGSFVASTFTVFAGTFLGGLLVSGLKYFGTTLIIGGITEMLTPQVSNRAPVSGQSSQDPAALAANYSFTGLTNVSNAGVPINLVYGEILVGSIVVSNGVDTLSQKGS